MAHVYASWLEVFLATSNSVIRSVKERWVHAYAGSEALFFADLEHSGWQWDECQESDCFGTWPVILVCAIAGICQA